MIWLILILNISSDMEKAPTFESYDLEGELVILDSLNKKKLLIIDFWSTICEPCVRQLDKAKELIEAYGDSLYYIAINEDPPMFQNRAKNFARSKDFKFIIILDEDGSIMENYGVTTLPTTYFLDDSLRILEIHQGFKVGDEEWFQETIKKYLGIKE